MAAWPARPAADRKGRTVRSRRQDRPMSAAGPMRPAPCRSRCRSRSRPCPDRQAAWPGQPGGQRVQHQHLYGMPCGEMPGCKFSQNNHCCGSAPGCVLSPVQRAGAASAALPCPVSCCPRNPQLAWSSLWKSTTNLRQVIVSIGFQCIAQKTGNPGFARLAACAATVMPPSIPPLPRPASRSRPNSTQPSAAASGRPAAAPEPWPVVRTARECGLPWQASGPRSYA